MGPESRHSTLTQIPTQPLHVGVSAEVRNAPTVTYRCLACHTASNVGASRSRFLNPQDHLAQAVAQIGARLAQPARDCALAKCPRTSGAGGTPKGPRNLSGMLRSQVAVPLPAHRRPTSRQHCILVTKSSQTEQATCPQRSSTLHPILGTEKKLISDGVTAIGGEDAVHSENKRDSAAPSSPETLAVTAAATLPMIPRPWLST